MQYYKVRFQINGRFFLYFNIAICLSGIVCQIKKCLIRIGNFLCNLHWSIPPLFVKMNYYYKNTKIFLTFFLSVCWFKCTGFRLHAFSKWFCAVTIDITQLPILVQRWEGLLWEAKWLHRQSSKLMYFHIPPFMLEKWN